MTIDKVMVEIEVDLTFHNFTIVPDFLLDNLSSGVRKFISVAYEQCVFLNN